MKITVNEVTTTDLPALQNQVQQQGLSIGNLQLVQSQHGTAISNLQQQYNSMSGYGGRIATLESGVNALNNSMSGLAGDVDGLGQDVSDLSDAVETLASGVSSAMGAIEDISRDGYEVTYGDGIKTDILSDVNCRIFLQNLASNGTLGTATVQAYSYEYDLLTDTMKWVQKGSPVSGQSVLGILNGAGTTPVGLGLNNGQGNQTPAIGTGVGAYAAANHTHAYTFAASNVGVEDGARVYDIHETTTATGASISALFKSHPTSGSSYTNGAATAGKASFPARADHAHPLNLVDVLGYQDIINATAGVKPFGATAGFGSYNFYCRLDHVHPVPTGGTGATGIGAAAPQESIPVGNITPSDANAGAGHAATWDRDSALASGNGFKVALCVGMKRVQVATNNYRMIAAFRTFTFDKYGLVRAVSKVTHCVSTVT